MRKGGHQTEETKEKIRCNTWLALQSEVVRKKMRESHIGYVTTEETKEKQRESHMGYVTAEETKQKQRESHMGEKNPQYKVPITEETKEKIRRTMVGMFIGEDNPNWINGKSNEPFPLEWTPALRESIHQRDGYRCQKCGKHQNECLRKLDVHHIDHNPKNLDPMNLITLCRRCNAKANSRTNRDTWQTYFENMLKERRIR